MSEPNTSTTITPRGAKVVEFHPGGLDPISEYEKIRMGDGRIQPDSKPIKTSEAPKPVFRRYELEHRSGIRPVLTPQLFQDVASEQNVKLAEADWLKQDAALNEKEKALGNLVAQNSHQAAREEIERQEEDYRQKLAQGKYTEAQSAPLVNDRNKFYEERARRKSEIKTEIRKIRAARALVFEKINARAVEAFQKAHDELEAAERADCARVGWPFTPSMRLICYGQAVWRIPQEFANGGLARYGIEL